MSEKLKVPFSRVILGILYFFGIPILLILLGGVNWWQAWIYIGFSYLASILSRLLIAKKHPDLIEERASFGEKTDAKAWDRKLAPLISMWIPLVYFIVAGLDKHFRWSPGLPTGVLIIAWLLVVVGFAVSVWAIVENRFFSAVVRIQVDRGHRVVETGPYHFVRHPGYASSLLVTLMFPLVLGTLWAYIPILAFVVLLVIRTRKEDLTLMEELPGYREYSMKTRFRLIPGVW